MLRWLRIGLGLLAGLLVAGGVVLAVGLASGGSGTTTTAALTVDPPASTPPPAPAVPSARPVPVPRLPSRHRTAQAGPAAARPGSPSRRPALAHPVPQGWYAVSPGAPSDAQVAAELTQVALLNRQRSGGFQTALASDFTDYGLGLACGGLLGTAEVGVANLTLPCGTMVTFRYRGRELRVPVIDRGPYIVGRLWDLTGATAAALGFPGLDQIQWRIG